VSHDETVDGKSPYCICQMPQWNQNGSHDSAISATAENEQNLRDCVCGATTDNPERDGNKLTITAEDTLCLPATVMSTLLYYLRSQGIDKHDVQAIDFYEPGPFGYRSFTVHSLSRGKYEHKERTPTWEH
jgi:hypothetical protein